MGGVINMVTKSNFSNKTFRYDAGIGSFNNSILNLNYSQKINNINLFTSFIIYLQNKKVLEKV